MTLFFGIFFLNIQILHSTGLQGHPMTIAVMIQAFLFYLNQDRLFCIFGFLPMSLNLNLHI